MGGEGINETIALRVTPLHVHLPCLPFQASARLLHSSGGGPYHFLTVWDRKSQQRDKWEHILPVAQDKRSTNQNSGVRIDATHPNGNKQTYYGRIDEIWELEYTPTLKIPLFKCQWVKVTGGGVTVDNEYGMTTVDLSNIGYKDDVKTNFLSKTNSFNNFN